MAEGCSVLLAGSPTWLKATERSGGVPMPWMTEVDRWLSRSASSCSVVGSAAVSPDSAGRTCSHIRSGSTCISVTCAVQTMTGVNVGDYHTEPAEGPIAPGRHRGGTARTGSRSLAASRSWPCRRCCRSGGVGFCHVSGGYQLAAFPLASEALRTSAEAKSRPSL